MSLIIFNLGLRADSTVLDLVGSSALVDGFHSDKICWLEGNFDECLRFQKFPRYYVSVGF